MLSDDADEASAVQRLTETANLLEQLQRAADEHRKILERQSCLIERLRDELRSVS